jgi:hypothetical protein
MKKITFISIICFLGMSLHAQETDTVKIFPKHYKEQNQEIKTLFSAGRGNGFYFGFHSGFSQINNDDAWDAGCRLAWIANHGLAVGFAGTGFATQPYNDAVKTDLNHNYVGGYGGLLVEPIVLPMAPVHLSFPIIIGAGGIAYSSFTDYNNNKWESQDYYTDDARAFFIVEPGIEAEINAVRWIRLAIGGSYRFTQRVDLEGDKQNPLEGFRLGFAIKFGKF